MSQRKASVHRQTGETEIRLELELEGSGQVDADTGVGFLDHMLHLLGRHAMMNLRVAASGDLTVDDHHLVEDVGIVFGQALASALGDKAGIARYGHCLLPMDEVLAAAAVDLSGRALFVSDYQPVRERVGELSTELVNHFFRSLATEAKMNLHFRLLYPGENEHHRVEALFKSFARALRSAVAHDPDSRGAVPSTKGQL